MKVYVPSTCDKSYSNITIHLTKTTAAQNAVALSYHTVRGLYFLAVVFAATIATRQNLKGNPWPCEALPIYFF